MSNLPTVNVTARVYDQSGKPVHKAVVTMRLTTVERYSGYIVPREVRAETDAAGKAVLAVWPNELGHGILRIPCSYQVSAQRVRVFVFQRRFRVGKRVCRRSEP